MSFLGFQSEGAKKRFPDLDCLDYSWLNNLTQPNLGLPNLN